MMGQKDPVPGQQQFDDYDKDFGVRFVLGEQQKEETMKAAIAAAGGLFDIIIDDGSHHNDINRWSCS